MRTIVSIIVLQLILPMPLLAQPTDAERLEAAKKRLEERQRLAAEAATRAATQPSTTRPAVRNSPVITFDEAVGAAVREMQAINAEPIPPGLTTLQKQEWEAKQEGRRASIAKGVIGQVFDASLVIVDVRPSTVETEVLATIHLDLPEAITKSMRLALSSIAKYHDDKISDLYAKMRNASPTLRKSYQERLDEVRDDREEAMAEERSRQAAIKQRVEIRVNGMPAAKLSGLPKGAKVLERVTVKSLSAEQSSSSRGREISGADLGVVRIELDVTPNATVTIAGAPTTALPAAQDAHAELKGLAEGLAAFVGRKPVAVTSEPPPGLTTIQAIRWKEEQAAREAAQQKPIVGQRFDVQFLVEDVVPVNLQTLKEDELARIRAATQSTTAVLATILFKTPDDVTPRKARLVLVATDDRFANMGKGDQVRTAAEVLLFEAAESRNRGAGGDQYRVVLSAVTPAAPGRPGK